ncbi:DNA polymerase III gamma and tau chains, partial [Ehrlichia ruminantium]
KMLGYVNRHVLLKIIESITNGNITEALNKFEEVCNTYSPVIVLDNILQMIYEICYFSITKKNDFLPDSDIITSTQNNKIQSPIFLSRLWQILSKGIQEVKSSACVKQAANMLIIRLCYLSDLPSPKQIIEKLQNNVKANENGLEVNRKMLLALLKTNNMQDLYNQLSKSLLEITYNNDCTSNIILNTMLPNNSQKELLNFLSDLTSKKWNICIKKNNDPCYNSQLDSTISDILQEFDGAKVINIETIKKEQQ